MLESITLNGFNVQASVDAYLHHCWFGYEGVFKYGEEIRCETVSNNILKLYDGLFVNQGRFYRIVPGSYEEVNISNGIVGQKRYDLIVSHFETNGVTETHDIRVLKGGNDGKIPEHTVSDTFNGGTVNEFPLYLVEIDGINITKVTRKFKYIISFHEALEAIINLFNAAVYTGDINIKDLIRKLDVNRE